MGQYYKCVMVNQNKEVSKYNLQTNDNFNNINDYRNYNGLKLMEHSWWENDFMRFVANTLVNNPTYLGWVGDYAEQDDFDNIPNNKLLNIDIESIWTEYDEEGNPISNKYGEDKIGIKDKKNALNHEKYFVSHTSKEYIDLAKYKRKAKSEEGWLINPISLMTAVGNGRGGGDFCTDYIGGAFVGKWAFDLVEITSEVPSDYKELSVLFVEDTTMW